VRERPPAGAAGPHSVHFNRLAAGADLPADVASLDPGDGAAPLLRTREGTDVAFQQTAANRKARAWGLGLALCLSASALAASSLSAGGAQRPSTLWPSSTAALEPLAGTRSDPVEVRIEPDDSIPHGAHVRIGALLEKVGQRIPPQTRERLAGALAEEEARCGLPPLLLLAMIGVESRYRLSAESERGAHGLLQLMPSTFAWIAAQETDLDTEELDLGDDPVLDVRLAARYLGRLRDRFEDLDLALIAYNAGPRNTARALKEQELPERWREYPQRVRREHQRLQGM
jgi:soluble lytic murein transglycosylase